MIPFSPSRPGFRLFLSLVMVVLAALRGAVAQEAPMTKQEVLSRIPPAHPFSETPHPPKACVDLISEIKRRGVSFKSYDVSPQESGRMVQGCYSFAESDVMTAIGENYRPSPAAAAGAERGAGAITTRVNGRERAAAAAVHAGTGSGLMTRAEVFARVPPAHPFSETPHPPQACIDLVNDIKRRGVSFRPDPKDSGRIGAGCYSFDETNVFEAIRENYGPRRPINWYVGNWDMTVIGATVLTTQRGYLVRQMERGAKAGTLTVSAVGTYTWKLAPTDPASKYVRGSWRPATPDEMQLEGGSGIVLRNAADGHDWLVREAWQIPSGDNIDVWDMRMRGSVREFGRRA